MKQIVVTFSVAFGLGLCIQLATGEDAEWSPVAVGCIGGFDTDLVPQIPDMSSCKQKCKDETAFTCCSVEFNAKEKQCVLSTGNYHLNADLYTAPCQLHVGRMYSQRENCITRLPHERSITPGPVADQSPTDNRKVVSTSKETNHSAPKSNTTDPSTTVHKDTRKAVSTSKVTNHSAPEANTSDPSTTVHDVSGGTIRLHHTLTIRLHHTGAQYSVTPQEQDTIKVVSTSKVTNHSAPESNSTDSSTTVHEDTRKVVSTSKVTNHSAPESNTTDSSTTVHEVSGGAITLHHTGTIRLHHTGANYSVMPQEQDTRKVVSTRKVTNHAAPESNSTDSSTTVHEDTRKVVSTSKVTNHSAPEYNTTDSSTTVHKVSGGAITLHHTGTIRLHHTGANYSVTPQVQDTRKVVSTRKVTNHSAPESNTSDPSTTVHKVSGCRSPWFLLGKQCFYIVDIKLSWTSAGTHCRELSTGADLAQPNNLKNLTDYLFTRDRFSNKYWIGGSDLAKEGDWRWVNNDTIDTIDGRWRDGEPNNFSGGEHCLLMYPEDGAKSLNDERCKLPHRFICERH